MRGRCSPAAGTPRSRSRSCRRPVPRSCRRPWPRRGAPGSPAPIVVQAGRVRAYHYALVLGGQRLVDVYTVPTSHGTVTVALLGVLYMPAGCDLAVPALRLARGAFLPLSADSAFLEALPTVVARLNVTRARLRERLARATLVEGGARTAGRLADAYGRAGRELRPLVAGPAARPGRPQTRWPACAPPTRGSPSPCAIAIAARSPARRARSGPTRPAWHGSSRVGSAQSAQRDAGARRGSQQCPHRRSCNPCAYQAD